MLPLDIVHACACLIVTPIPSLEQHHRAVVITQTRHVRRLVETIPDAEPCDVVDVASAARAYSLIKQVAPELVDHDRGVALIHHTTR